MWLRPLDCRSVHLCQEMALNYVPSFIKAFHFLPEQISSGRRNNGDTSGVRVPLYWRKTKQ